MSNIRKAFENGKAFIPFITCGDPDLETTKAAVRENTDIPCAVGFGISTPEQAGKMAAVSDGAIVGSAIVKLLAKYGKDAPAEIGRYVKSMKDGVREA